jgi:glycosyltransferase involved in cell wall biosynthesis
MIVWYLNHYASVPDAGAPSRPHHLAGIFRKYGHTMVVFCASFHHHMLRLSSPINENELSIYGDVPYYHIAARYYAGNGWRRFLNMRDFARGLARLRDYFKSAGLPRPDVIIASSPHVFIWPPARKLSRYFQCPIIGEVRDLWPQELVDVGRYSAWHPGILWMSAIEKRAYRDSAAVVSLLPAVRDFMEQRGLASDRFVHIPNGVSADEWAEEPEPLPDEYQRLVDQIKMHGKLLVVYTGAHGIPNALDQVLDLQKLVTGERSYHFVFIGDGINKPGLQNRAHRERINFVTFLPRMKKSIVRSALLQADICFIGWQNKEIYQYGISPNKIGDYFMAGKPVVHAVNAGNDPVRDAGAGISLEPYNPEQLDETLRRFAAMDPQERREMGERGRRYALDHLEWGLLGKKYVELCERIAAQRGSVDR